MKFLLLTFLSTNLWAHELKILSWNVFMLPKPIKLSLQKTRSKFIAKSLASADYDLMLFQEAFDHNFRNTMNAQVKKNFPFTYYLGRDRQIEHVMGSGVFIMSKHPFKILGHVYYKNCATADCFAAKGAVMIELELPDGERAQLVTTHMQSQLQYDNIRAKQLAQIQKMMELHKRRNVPQILMGDLNISNLSTYFGRGQNDMNMTYTPLDGEIQYTSGLRNDCYQIAGAGHEWIDHAWVSNDNRVLNAQMHVRVFEFPYEGKVCPASDHHAIDGTFSF